MGVSRQVLTRDPYRDIWMVYRDEVVDRIRHQPIVRRPEAINMDSGEGIYLEQMGRVME